MSNAILSAVSSAAFKAAHSDGDIIAAVQAAKAEDQDAVRAAFVAGYMAGRLNPAATKITAAMLSKAAAALAAKGYKAGAAASSKPRRNEEEEKAYNGARQAWMRVLAKASVKTTATQGGARKAGPERKAAAPEAAKPEAAKAAAPEAAKAAAPKVKTADEAREHIELQATSLMHFEKKNAAKLPLAYKAAVEAFHAAIEAAKAAAE